MYKKGCIHRVPLLNAHHVQRDLETLYPGQSGLLLQGDYYIRKLRLFLLVLCVGTLLGVLAHARADMEGSLTSRRDRGRGRWNFGLGWRGRIWGISQ